MASYVEHWRYLFVLRCRLSAAGQMVNGNTRVVTPVHEFIGPVNGGISLRLLF